MFILDTDHISILQRAEQPAISVLSKRMSEAGENLFFVSIVSFQEQTSGWNAYLNRAKQLSDVVHGYDMHLGILDDYSEMQVLPFRLAEGNIFSELRSKIRVSTLDLRIAATALANDMTLLTRNTVDFAKVPGLRFEDWTRPL